MDPITLSLIAGLSGAASAKFVGDVWESGKKWISKYYDNHGEEVRKKAEENTLVFLGDLAKRVDDIEKSTNNSETSKSHLQTKLNDPDFAAMLHDAIIASARTSSKFKHEILSRTISERLKSNNNNLSDVASSMAVNSLPYLNENHLNTLGIITVIQNMSPDDDELNITNPEEFPSAYTEWLNKWLSWIPDDYQIAYFDYMHLVSTSCITYSLIGTKDLKSSLTPINIEFQKTHPWLPDDFLKTHLGSKILKLWEHGMNKTNLTATGMLIGSIVVDIHLKTNTKIYWDDGMLT